MVDITSSMMDKKPTTTATTTMSTAAYGSISPSHSSNVYTEPKQCTLRTDSWLDISRLNRRVLFAVAFAAICCVVAFASVETIPTSSRFGTTTVSLDDAVSPAAPVAVAGDPTTPGTPAATAPPATAKSSSHSTAPLGSQACPNGPPVAPGTPCPGPDGVAPALSPDQAAQIAKQASDAAAAAAVASQAAQTAQNLKNQAYAAHQAVIAQQAAEKNAAAATAAKAKKEKKEENKSFYFF
eukprot:jgi/Bigna1/145640/aug1.101_g20348